jgi:predicted O-linked N-acetylglucosamine transferase (SPINDLY family)
VRLPRLPEPSTVLSDIEPGASLEQAVRLWRAGRREEAQRLCESLVQAGDDPQALGLLAEIYEASGQAARAAHILRRLLAAAPPDASTHRRLGQALIASESYGEAVTSLRAALALDPGNGRAHNELGQALVHAGEHAEALQCYERAIALDPADASAHNNLAQALQRLGRPEEAGRALERVLEIDGGFKLALGALVSARAEVCDFRDDKKLHDRLTRAVSAGKPASTPFTFLMHSQDPSLQLRCARQFAAEQLPPSVRRAWSGARPTHGRIRVAYLSADFHEHPTATLAAGLFEAHDRHRFEITAVSFGPDDSSAMRQRLKCAFDRFLDVRSSSDAQVAQQLRSREIDIAVDLKGYTGDSRPGILARRAAPLQVSYLGYPGTTGLEEIDYLLADEIVVPPSQQAHYSEQIVYLPQCYQVNDSRRAIAEQAPRREEVGLPESGFVFCCFNSPTKIRPAVFDIWCRLLKQVPGSVLWLLQADPVATRNLKHEASERGVDAQRLVFAPRISQPEHLARHRLADLFLDTLPCNAQTSCSDALWSGLPVLTCLGNTFAGRVAGSALRAAGLPELIAQDLKQYAARALELARKPARLAELRSRLASNRDQCPLFDTARQVRNLESAYTLMWERYRGGLPPASFAVPGSPA